MTALEVIRLVNSGILIYDNVAPLIENALATGQDVSIEDLEAASGQLGTDLQLLADAIARAKARGR